VKEIPDSTLIAECMTDTDNGEIFKRHEMRREQGQIFDKIGKIDGEDYPVLQ
jgi:hypothetical protein